LLLCAFQAAAQSYTVSGTVHSADEGSGFPSATVMLLNPQDSAVVTGAVTDFEGLFELTEVKSGNYVFKAQYIGYEPILKPISIEKQDLDLGILTLKEETTLLQDITITAKRATGNQKGDTAQFDASAFKTMDDASAQTLVVKLPGVSTQDGELQAEGEKVVKILVDGKPFFGQDVKTALQNLPAEVIESVQIFDQLSDKAQMTGFDDGEREKTINIITKPNRRSGQFGRMTAGYGTDDRYLVGASINFFNEKRRITVTGLSNNVNVVGYSADPNSQGETRPQNGIINTQTAGVNFTDEWGSGIEVTGSYLFSQRRNQGYSTLIRQYILSSEEDQIYREENNDVQRDLDHRIRMRIEYNKDENNRVIFRPYASIRNDKEDLYFFGRTTVNNDTLNQSENSSQANNDDYDFGGRLIYGHRFRKKGRSLTFDLRGDYHANADRAYRQAENIFYGDQDRIEYLNQYTTRDRTGFSWETEVSYTEPVGEKGRMELEYEVGNRWNDSDRITYDIIEEIDPTEFQLVPDTALSNTFVSDYLSQEVEVGYRYQMDKFRLQVEAGYRRSDLMNDQEFPQPFHIKRTFENFAPTVRLDFQFTENKRLDVDYDTYINTPDIDELQDVIDISNPLHLRTGNPELDQAFSNRFRIRYRSRNPETDKSFFLYLSSMTTTDYITNSTIVAEEPMELEEGIILEPGSQLTRPVNMDGYWNFRSYMNYGLPLYSIKSNGNIFGSVNYRKEPGMINEQKSLVSNANLRLGFRVSSNINKSIDFNFSSSSNFNLTENSLQPSLNNNYFYQSTRISYDWLIGNNIIYRLDLNHRYNQGLAEEFEQNVFLVNMSIGSKLLKNNRAELSLNVYDLFSQNNNIRRNVTELYIEDSESNVLQRYFMLTFSYNLRHFNKGTSMEDYRKLHGDD